MQAIILAAGMGKRLGEYTKDNTKCMLPVNGMRLIDRYLTALSHYDLTKVVIVIGYKGQSLKEYIGNRYDKSIRKIEYIENPVYDKTNNIYSLSLAKDVLKADDTILLESDLIFDEEILERLINNKEPNLAVVSEWESWMDGTVVRIDSDRNIVSFVPKKIFNYADIDSYYKTVNIYKFSTEFSTNKYIPFLNAYCEAWGNNEYYEEVLRVLTFLNENELKAMPVNGLKWYEIDDVQDLDIAETLFADDESVLAKYHQRYGGYWRFPKLLDFCYLVNPFFPPREMVDEMSASFHTLLTEYPSGMGVNSLLASKYFGVSKEYIAVGNGAAELIKCIMEKNLGKVGVVYPTFEEYPNRLSQNDIVAYFAKAPEFRYGIDELISFYSYKNISVLLLINPDNPTGNYVRKNDVLRLAEWCAECDVKLIVDESFVDFTDDYANNSLLNNAILKSFTNLIVVKSISKSYGVPGLRLGVVASSNTEIIESIKKEVAIWNINSFAEYYMQIFGKYEKQYVKACDAFIEEREWFASALSKLPFIKVLPSQANYFMIKVDNSISIKEMAKMLLKEYSILIKDCNSKHGLENENCIRIAVRNREDNQRLIDALHSLAVRFH